MSKYEIYSKPWFKIFRGLLISFAYNEIIIFLVIPFGYIRAEICNLQSSLSLQSPSEQHLISKWNSWLS